MHLACAGEPGVETMEERERRRGGERPGERITHRERESLSSRWSCFLLREMEKREEKEKEGRGEGEEGEEGEREHNPPHDGNFHR